MKVASFFSGCGGSCLGFEQAGYEVVYANEFIPSARLTYAANHPNVPIDERDIREVKAEDIPETDVIEGSPPCSSYSTSGKLSKGWGKPKHYSDGVKQRTDDLLGEYVRIVKGVQPRAFVMENVPSLTRGKSLGVFKNLMRDLADGYHVESRLIDASWLGVPQARVRLFIMGFRDDLGVTACPWPAPLPERATIGEHLPWLLDGDLPPDLDECPVSLEGYKIRGHAEALVPGEKSWKRHNLRVAHPGQPCPTITQVGVINPGSAGVIAPCGTRKFTLLELRRLFGFPDDFKLVGTCPQKFERLGRAVCPPVMKALALGIRGVLDEGR